MSCRHKSLQPAFQGQYRFHKDRISFTFWISHPLETERLFSGECKVHPHPYPPLMMEAVCFRWGKINLKYIKLLICSSPFSVPFSYLVHACVWDVVCQGERAELGLDGSKEEGHGPLVLLQRARKDLYPMKCPCGKSATCGPIPQRGMHQEEILVCCSGELHLLQPPPNSASSG